MRHEFKAPIAKGEIVDVYIKKGRRVLIFEKLDFLITDFEKIEQVVSKTMNTKMVIIFLKFN